LLAQNVFAQLPEDDRNACGDHEGALLIKPTLPRRWQTEMEN